MNLYRQTGDLRLVQTALGHRHISTTEIYYAQTVFMCSKVSYLFDSKGFWPPWLNIIICSWLADIG